MTAKSSNTKKPVPSTIRRLNEETEGIADEDLKDFVGPFSHEHPHNLPSAGNRDPHTGRATETPSSASMTG